MAKLPPSAMRAIALLRDKETERIVVIGRPGAGKSTFASKLASILGLPVYHVDAIRWLPHGREIPRQRLFEQVSQILARAQWVIDCGGLAPRPRLGRIQLIVALEAPSLLALGRVVARTMRLRWSTTHGSRQAQAGNTRVMPITYLWYVWRWRARHPAYADDLAARVGEHVLAITLSVCQARTFLVSLRAHRPISSDIE
jgi:hypothetical protein